MNARLPICAHCGHCAGHELYLPKAVIRLITGMVANDDMTQRLFQWACPVIWWAQETPWSVESHEYSIGSKPKMALIQRLDRSPGARLLSRGIGFGDEWGEVCEYSGNSELPARGPRGGR